VWADLGFGRTASRLWGNRRLSIRGTGGFDAVIDPCFF